MEAALSKAEVRSAKVSIVADDLTGACDAAAPFAGRGARTLVLLGDEGEVGQAQVMSWCTGSRDAVPDAESASVAQTLARLLRKLDTPAGGAVFKKIDSTFRGNTFAELAVTARAFPDRLTLIAPAFPALGRTCSGGMLHVHDASGRHTVPLREPLHAAGLEPVWLAPTLDRGSLAQAFKSVAAVFCEATSDAELRTIVQAALLSGRRLAWAGSAGLAHALAAELYPGALQTPLVPAGPLVCFSGSNHPVTQRQFAALNGQATTLHVQRGITTDAEIGAFAARHTFRTLMLVGGDTALQVCRALGFRRLELYGEYAPGVPQGTACGGPYAGTAIVIKSGGFGAEDLLLRLAEQCRANPCRKAQP